jgi:hypothetical protein
MALMDPRDVLAIADRIGKRYYYTLLATVSGSPDSASTRGSNFFEMAHVCPDGDPEIEITTLSQASASDNAWNTTTDPFALAATLMGGASSSYSIIGALTNHFNTATSGGSRALTGGWNQYLESADPTGTDYTGNPTFPGDGVGVRVSEYFRRIYSSAGGANLRARNVFYDSPTPFSFGVITGAAGNTVSYEDLGDFGNGTVNDIANGENFAATRMKLVAGAGGWTGSTDIELQLVTEPDGDVETVTVSGVSLGASGQVLIGADDQARYTKVNGVSVTGGTTTVGETLTIQNVFERVIEL